MAGLALAWLLADERVTQIVSARAARSTWRRSREALAHPLTGDGARRDREAVGLTARPRPRATTTCWPRSRPRTCAEAMAAVLAAHARGEALHAAAVGDDPAGAPPGSWD